VTKAWFLKAAWLAKRAWRVKVVLMAKTIPALPAWRQAARTGELQRFWRRVAA